MRMCPIFGSYCRFSGRHLACGAVCRRLWGHSEKPGQELTVPECELSKDGRQMRGRVPGRTFDRLPSAQGRQTGESKRENAHNL